MWEVLKDTPHAKKIGFLETVAELKSRGFSFEKVGSEVKIISGSEGVNLGKITHTGLDLEDFGYIGGNVAASNIKKLPIDFNVFDNGNDLTGKLEIVTDAYGNTKFRWSSGSGKPQWLKTIEEGNNFNANRKDAFPYNEVYLINPNDNTRYVRLDSYDHIANEIFSRKFTQLSDIQEATAFKYIDELVTKYPPNTQIATVPSNTTPPLPGQTNNFGILDHGGYIQGTMVLELPVQIQDIPQSIIDYAKNKVKLRDINGKNYN